MARLVDAVRAALAGARRQQVVELIPFVTSAVRDAANRDEILRALAVEAQLAVGFLSGEDEARLTYFAAHRWYGWSAGPLLLLDIGGGSMEIAQGRDEDPALGGPPGKQRRAPDAPERAHPFAARDQEAETLERPRNVAR